MTIISRLAALGALGCCYVCAQSSQPDLGLLFDPAGKSLRRVLGVPGSAFYGASLDLGLSVSSAAIAPSQDFTLVTNNDGVFAVRLKDGATYVRPLDGVVANPDRLVLSPNGAYGALYYADRQLITIAGPIGGDSTATRDVPVAGLTGTAQAIAISDDGMLIAILAGDGGDPPQTVLTLLKTDTGETKTVLTSPHGSAVAFIPGAPDVLLTDDVESSVSVVRDVAGSAQRTVVLSGDSRLTAPSDVLATSDGSHVLAASSTTGTLAMLDLGGSDPAFLTCRCEPNGVRRLSSKLLFQVTPLKDGIAWMMEWDPTNPRLLFVPPEVGLIDQSGTVRGDY